jgi:transposase-like protein
MNCPKCNGVAWKVGLRTRPIVYRCEDCDEMFTVRSRIPQTKLRTVRR